MKKLLKWILYFFIAMFVLGLITSFFADDTSSKGGDATTELATEEPNNLTQLPDTTVNYKAVTSWEYQEDRDEMREQSSFFATNSSQNTVELDFPYQGGTKLTIILRDDAKHGQDVMFGVNKGQLFCQYRDCHINIKFDNGEIERYETNEAEAGASEVLFLAGNKSKFVEKIKKSKTAMIEVNFYNHGAEQFKFDLSGLEWSHF